MQKISCIILAGGRATRMGGIDKGLIHLANKPLIEYVIERIKPQVDELFINANRQLDAYQAYGLPILQDLNHDFIGPLAGFQLGLSHAQFDSVLIVPCDSPLVPTDLAACLLTALTKHQAEIVVAKSDGNTHPVFCLCKKSVLTSLEGYLEQGERKISTWQKSLKYLELDLSNPNAQGITEAFINLNTFEELNALALSIPNKMMTNNEKPFSTNKDKLADMVANPNLMDDYDPNALSVNQAKQYIRQFLNPISEVETIPIEASLNRILATAILSPANVPNYDNSAMDGYAFHSDNLSVETTQLKVIGTVLAGKGFDQEVKHGECVRIMTGGMMPKGTDTVVMQEKVTRQDDSIQLEDNPKPHQNVRYAGEDLAINQTVLCKGHSIKPADIGLMASLGFAEVNVYRTLKVAIFSTGDELVSVGKPLEKGQVYDSNRYTIMSMLKRLNVEMIDFGAIPDHPDQLESALLKSAEQADVVITTGGVSVGEADYMKQLLAQHGQVLFWKIAMKPGRPLAYGKLSSNKHSAHYFGLPGNPVAVMVTFYQFVREALLTIMGQENIPSLPTFNVVCTQDIKKMTGRTEFQRGICYLDDDHDWKVRPTGAQGSAILSSMSAANCFIVLDETIGNLAAGSQVKVQLFDGLI